MRALLYRQTQGPDEQQRGAERDDQGGAQALRVPGDHLLQAVPQGVDEDPAADHDGRGHVQLLRDDGETLPSPL